MPPDTLLRQPVTHHKNHICTILWETVFLHTSIFLSIMWINIQFKSITGSATSNRSSFQKGTIVHRNSSVTTKHLIPEYCRSHKHQQSKSWRFGLWGENEHKDLGHSHLCETIEREINETPISFNYVIQKPQSNRKLTKYLKHLRKQTFIGTSLLLSCKSECRSHFFST